MAAADTQYSWTQTDPRNTSRAVTLILQDSTVAWRFSATAGQVAAPGGGTPVPAGGQVEFPDGLQEGVTVYFASSSGSAEVMRIEREVAS